MSTLSVNESSPTDGRADRSAPIPAGDPRLDAFAGLLAAIDRRDTPTTITSIRALRRIGFSVVLTGRHKATPIAPRPPIGRPSTEGGRR